MFDKIEEFFKRLFNSIEKRIWGSKDDNKSEEGSNPKPSQPIVPPVKPAEPKPKPVVSTDPENPVTDAVNPEIFAFLWKPKADYRPDAVVVAWSNNIAYQDLMFKVTNKRGRVIAEGGVYPGFIRGKNKHRDSANPNAGNYGGINFDVQRPGNKIRYAIVSFYLKGTGKLVPVAGLREIHIEEPGKRLEINYKDNLNYNRTEQENKNK